MNRARLFMLLLAASYPVAGTSQSGPGIKHGEVIRFRSSKEGPGGAGELFRPTIGKPGTWPGVLLVPDSEGLTDSIRAFANTLAVEGYMVLAMEPYDGKPSPTDRRDGWTREADHSDNLIKIEDGSVFLKTG